ncbi:glycosyltransferase [Thalassotalea nanhaiensis]|uniref:Glycosyltransferase n=1 Tax=Thalassotalea nanhaiensis TaxID=3065648 RepID=A0ABY9TMU0_9GAMM|nr:glycosyltransferase [Colwelliaceae bacterium SQ345]
MNKLNITVVIPLYNKAQHILKTLNSVYQQQNPAYEVVVVNDGSTDNSLEVVKTFKTEKNLENLIIIDQDNAGVSAARNEGALLANSPFIAFLDADDLWLPLYLTKITSMIHQSPFADIFACKYQCKLGENNYKDAKIRLNHHQHIDGILVNYFECASQGDLPFIVSSSVIKRSSFKKFGMFPLNEPMGEDQALFSHIAIHGLIAYSTDIHVIYNLAAENRACINNIPKNELPFSKRLTATTELIPAVKYNSKYRKAILTFCAAHLCHLAKLNIKAMQFSRARALLADKRCWLKPKHKICLYLWSMVAQCKNSIQLKFSR